MGLTVPLVFGSAFALAGCTGQPLSTRERATLGGGMLGVGSGAIMGSAVGHPGAGAAIGGALGAGTGYVIGIALQNQEVTSPQQQGQTEYQQRAMMRPFKGGLGMGAQDLVTQEQGAKMEKETLDEKLPGLFEPDTLLPIQYFEAMRRKHLLEGEKRLVMSVLEDAVECFMKCIDSSTNKGKRLFRDAEEWINLEDRKWVFSFDNVCEMLDVNPDYLRRGLREWKVRKLDAIERTRIARAEQAALAAAQPAVAEAEASVAEMKILKPVAKTAVAKAVAVSAPGLRLRA